MGRHLILACDNCVPGDASGWYLPLALGTVALCAVAGVLLGKASRRSGRRRLLLLVAAGALVLGPVGAVAAVSGGVTSHGATCGSALKASLERGVPDDSALDVYQSGCKRVGSLVVRSAAAWAGLAVLVAAGTAGASLLPRRTAVA